MLATSLPLDCMFLVWIASKFQNLSVIHFTHNEGTQYILFLIGTSTLICDWKTNS